MADKIHEAKWTGVDKQRVPGIGIFSPGEPLPITEEQAAILRGVGDPLYLIDGESIGPEPEEKPVMAGKVPAEKKGALKETVKELVNEGELPAGEAGVTVSANLKKGGKK